MVDELVTRAMAAYFRTAKADGATSPPQPAADSAVERIDGLDYVVLRNTDGPLAVYRIRNDGSLKRLRRWPGVLDGD